MILERLHELAKVSPNVQLFELGPGTYSGLLAELTASYPIAAAADMLREPRVDGVLVVSRKGIPAGSVGVQGLGWYMSAPLVAPVTHYPPVPVAFEDNQPVPVAPTGEQPEQPAAPLFTQGHVDALNELGQYQQSNESMALATEAIARLQALVGQPGQPVPFYGRSIHEMVGEPVPARPAAEHFLLEGLRGPPRFRLFHSREKAQEAAGEGIDWSEAYSEPGAMRGDRGGRLAFWITPLEVKP